MKKIPQIIFSLIIFASANFAFSQTATITDNQIKELVPSSTRLVHILDGVWDVSLDDSQFERMNLPVSISQSKRIVLQRNFTIEKSLLTAYEWTLNFLGFNYEAEIFVNEQFIGKFISNFIKSSIAIPRNVLTSSNNTLKIIITKSDKFGFYSNDIYAPIQTIGMQRSILLIGSPQLKVNSIAYKTKINRDFSTASLQTKIIISSKDLANLSHSTQSDTNKIIGTQKEYELQINLIDKTTGLTISQSNRIPFKISPQRTITLDYTFNLQNINSWSIDNPNLYEISASLYTGGYLIDNYSATAAFRTFTVEKNGNSSRFLMNYQNFQFKAVNYVENIGQNGYFLSLKKIEEDFKQLKVLGANTIIFRYHFPSPYMLALCDKYGMLALIESPIYNADANLLGKEILLTNLSNQIKSFVNEYSHHPSIVAFSIGEGLDDSSPQYANYLDIASDALKSETDWLLYRIIYPTTPNVNFDKIDFLFFKEFNSRQNFNKINSDYNKLRNNIAPIPLVMSFGVPIQNDNHNGYSDPLSVEFQSYYFANLYKISIVNNGFGCAIFNYNDYRTQKPILSTRYINDPISTSGVVYVYGKTKSSFNVLKSLFNDEREPIIDIGNYSTTVYIFIIVSFIILIIFLYIFSRFKRFQEYFTRAALRPFNFYSDIRDQRILSPSYTYIIGIFNSLSFGIFAESFAYFYRTNEAFGYLMNLIIPSITVQKYIYNIIWMPAVGIVVFSIFFLICLFIISLLIKLFAYFKHLRIHSFDTISIVNWGSLPFLYLLPIDVLLHRLLQIDLIFSTIFLIFAALVLISSIFRIIRATSVVFDIQKSQSFIVGLSTILLILIIVFSLYQSQTNLMNSLSYLFTILM